jgi:hypothetical protein
MANVTWHDHVTHTIDVPEKLAGEVAKLLSSTVNLLDDPAVVVKNLIVTGPNEAGTYAGITRLVELGADAKHVSKLLAGHHNHVNSGKRYRNVNSAASIIARLHDPSVAHALYDFIKKHGLSYFSRLLEGEGANVVEGLVGMCARKGTKRDFALDALRGYIDRGHADLVRASVARAPSKITDLLTQELFAPEDTPSLEGAASSYMTEDAMPYWLRDVLALPERFASSCEVDGLPPVTLAGHDAPLPPRALDRIFAAVAARPSPTYYEPEEVTLGRAARAGLAHLRGALDPEHADAFWCEAWERTFMHGGERAKHDFLRALAHFGHGRAILIVGDLLGTTSKHLGNAQYGTRAASQGLLGTGEALAYEQLVHASETVTSKNGRKGLLRRADLVAHFGGEDERALWKHYPRYGLDDRAERSVDYGSGRAFTLFLNMSCELTVRDHKTGKTRASLPKARKGEDAERIGWLVEDFSRQRKRIRRMRDVIVKELERDLVLMTPRTLAEFTAHFETSPLHRRICSSLLWGIYDAEHQLVAAFRPDLEGARLDADYEPVTSRVTSTRHIALVHPLDLDELRRAAWSQHFADAELVSPFPQLDRKCVAPHEWEAERAWHKTIPRFEDVSIKLRRFPRWFATYTQKARNRPKAWMAMWRSDVLGLDITLINASRTWKEGSGPARGLFFTPTESPLSTEVIVPWEDVPARFVSEALCAIEAAYEKVHGPLER